MPVAGVGCFCLATAISIFSCLADPEVVRWCNTLFDVVGLQSKSARLWILNAPNLWHVILYGFLAFGLMLMLPNRSFLAGSLAMAFGTVLEAVQWFVPTRSVNLTDLLYNLLGIWAAWLVFNQVTVSATRTAPEIPNPEPKPNPTSKSEWPNGDR